MGELRIETLGFRQADRQRWASGSNELIEQSAASPFLKRVLAKKHLKRPNRFFGEAFVASHVSHDEGYYSSFKWLTSRKWTDKARLDTEDSAEFRLALARHFPRIGELQTKASTFVDSLGGQKPVGPNLWLITNDEHRFIGVKLPKDEVAAHQVAGLALLAKCLPSVKPISVSVITLDCNAEQFADFVNRLTT